jgi:hypothetical protein
MIAPEIERALDLLDSSVGLKVGIIIAERTFASVLRFVEGIPQKTRPHLLWLAQFV